MRKKILVIGNDSNGMFLFRKTLLSELVRAGHEVTVLTPFDYNVNDIRALGTKAIETPMDRRSTNPVADINLLKSYRRIFKEEKPDFVITYTIKPNIYGGITARRMKIPYAVNITGLGTAFQNEGVLKRFVVKMYRAALKTAHTVFFENSECREVFLNNGICPANTSFILNGAGVDLTRFELAEYPLQDTVRFLFIGRIMKEKGVDELFEAMRRLYREKQNCELWMLGSCEEDYHSVIEKYSAEGWLTYYGHQQDVRPFIEQSHCFVLPSWHEGMANTNLECAAMGRPVITSNIHGCLEAVEDCVSGFLCDKQNADDLYRLMGKFVSLSYEQRKAMGRAGRERMERLFDRRVIVSQTLNQLDLA